MVVWVTRIVTVDFMHSAHSYGEFARYQTPMLLFLSTYSISLSVLKKCIYRPLNIN